VFSPFSLLLRPQFFFHWNLPWPLGMAFPLPPPILTGVRAFPFFPSKQEFPQAEVTKVASPFFPHHRVFLLTPSGFFSLINVCGFWTYNPTFFSPHFELISRRIHSMCFHLEGAFLNPTPLSASSILRPLFFFCFFLFLEFSQECALFFFLYAVPPPLREFLDFIFDGKPPPCICGSM